MKIEVIIITIIIITSSDILLFLLILLSLLFLLSQITKYSYLLFFINKIIKIQTDGVTIILFICLWI